MMKHKSLILITIFLLSFLSACGNAGFAGSLENSLKGINIQPDSNAGNTFENLNNFGYAAHDGENLYFAFINKRLCKYSLVDHTMTELLAINAQSLNVLDGWIYYLNVGDLFNDNGDSFSIYKVDVNGNGNQKISDIRATFLYVQDDIIYAKGIYEEFNCNIYTMNLDGSNAEVLCNQEVESFYLHDGHIYFTESLPWDGTEPIVNSRLSKMSLDSGEQSVLVEGFCRIEWFTIHEDNIFFVAAGNLYKMGLSEQELKMGRLGQTLQSVAEFGCVFSSWVFNVHGEAIYYTTSDLSESNYKLKLHTFDMVTEKAEEIIVRNFGKQNLTLYIHKYVIGDKIIWNENDEYFVMDLDGSNIQPFS